jgi:hypothetical protein
MPMNDPRLVFEPVAHTYHWEGRRLPSVSEVMRFGGLTHAKWFTDAARARGQYVHQGIVLWHVGELDVAAIEPAYRGYFEAYWRWINRHQPDVRHMECRVANALKGVAGTADQVIFGEIIGVERPVMSWDIAPWTCLDIKTGGVPRSVGPQTALYGEEIADALVQPYVHRAVLNLRADGTYKFNWLEDMSDHDVFSWALGLYHWSGGHRDSDDE